MKKGVDKEWIALILEAKALGLTPEEIRTYLQVAAESDKTKEGFSS